MGSWKAGMASGNGTQTFGNGDRYEGGWKAGMMSGQVMMKQKGSSTLIHRLPHAFKNTPENSKERTLGGLPTPCMAQISSDVARPSAPTADPILP